MAKRKILISYGHGAGWTTWESNREMQRFMLEYPPLIEYIEKHGNGDLHYPYNANVYTASGKLDMQATLENLEGVPEVVRHFIVDCHAKFNATPFMGGIRGLTVQEVEGRVRLFEYDGYENYEEEDEFSDWL